MISNEMTRIIKAITLYREKYKKSSIKGWRSVLEMMGNITKLPKYAKIESIKVDEIPLYWIYTDDSKEDKVILYLHGGGYVAGSLNTHKEFIARLSKNSGARVLFVDYRLAPENPYPAAIEDSVSIYKWLLANGYEPNNIIIGGDSAGGGLALAALLKLKDERIPLPVAAICLSPWIDLALTGESIMSKAKLDPMLSNDLLELASKAYIVDQDPKNPYISPLYGDLSGLPPMIILVGTSETLLDDSIRFTELAKKANIDIKLKIWEEMIHVFPVLSLRAPESVDAIEQIKSFIDSFFK